MKFDFIELNNRKFDVKRVIPSANVTEPMIAVIKELWDCDVVLQRGEMHYFVAELEEIQHEEVVKIPTAEPISGEISDTKAQNVEK
jgi:hypothetical protein